MANYEVVVPKLGESIIEAVITRWLKNEGEMIQGIFSFRDTIAREIMVPRTDAVFANAETKIADVVQLIIQSGHSRIPIYHDNIDNLIGTVHAKDLAKESKEKKVGGAPCAPDSSRSRSRRR